MPVKGLIDFAWIVFFGIVVTHPLTFRAELRKVQYAILREVSDTRSWGNPSIFRHGKRGWTYSARLVERSR